jgi:hypothetical protein
MFHNGGFGLRTKVPSLLPKLQKKFPSCLGRSRNNIKNHCVEDYFETFVQIYDEHFSRQYGFWRPYIEQVIYRYLDAACPVPDTGAICTTGLSA